MKILVHHHCGFYIKENKCFMPSFIGIWFSGLSENFEFVGFIGIRSYIKSEKFDFCFEIKENNKFFEIEINKKFKYGVKELIIPDIEIIRRFNFDVLLVRGITPLQFFIYNKFRSLKVIFLLVGSIVDSKPKLRFNRTSLIKYIYYWIRIYQFKLISKNAKIFANSPQVVLELMSELKIASSFLPTNSIRLSDFSTDLKNKFSIPIKILFCGRVTREKGIEELLYAVKLLKDENQFPQLSIVGYVEKKYYAFLKRIIREFEIETMVKFFGFIPFGENLFSIYKSSDIYVLPSWHEGFPHSLWEAACNFTPIITTSVGGIPGLINSSFVNFIELKNPISIKNEIIDCIKNPEEKFYKAAIFFEYAKKYTIEACISKLKNEIEKI